MRKNNNLVGVDNHGIQWRGVVLLYTYTESVEEKNMMKKGKKWRRKEDEKKKCSWLDLNSAPLYCEESV